MRTDPNNKRWRTYCDGHRTVHKDLLGNAAFEMRDRVGGQVLRLQDEDGNRIEYQPKQIMRHFDVWNRIDRQQRSPGPPHPL